MFLSINALILNFFVLFQYSNADLVTKKFDPYNMDPSYRVPKISTPLSEKEIAESLCVSHIEIHGAPPSKNRLALSWAQISLENARGKKVWNNLDIKITPHQFLNQQNYSRQNQATKL
jgi:hypothetical protein